MTKVYGDRWKTIDSLREGGQAHTFLVTDVKGGADKQYVLKRLKNIKRISRFKQEIEAIRNLAHINILKLFDFDLDGEKPFLVTEYCSGGSLAEAEQPSIHSPERAFTIFMEVCEGILHAHSNGITHRDIKPDNIFLRSEMGPAVVGDFGICHMDADGTRITVTEEAVGPRLFMAPELEDGRLDDISKLSDTYSLGKLLYWLLSEGQVFSREKHREKRFDLKGLASPVPGQGNNIYMEHANRLLDQMICDDPSCRIPVEQVLDRVREVARLIKKEFNPLGKGIRQPCTYCGYGYYNLNAVSATDVKNFGFNPVGVSNWRILTCGVCGHVQSFRIENINMKEWWG